MAATVMTVEFGTIYHYSSLGENSEACLCSLFEQKQKLKEYSVILTTSFCGMNQKI